MVQGKDMIKTVAVIFGATISFLFAIWLGWIVITALRSGVACIAGGKEFKRETSSFVFWITVSAQTGFAVMFFVIGIMNIMRHLK